MRLNRGNKIQILYVNSDLALQVDNLAVCLPSKFIFLNICTIPEPETSSSSIFMAIRY